MPCASYGKKWGRAAISNRLLPYKTIVKAHESDPEAVNAVLQHYAGYIRYCSMMDGKVNTEIEEYVTQRLIESLFKFRFDRPPDNPKTE